MAKGQSALPASHSNHPRRHAIPSHPCHPELQTYASEQQQSVRLDRGATQPFGSLGALESKFMRVPISCMF